MPITILREEFRRSPLGAVASIVSTVAAVFTIIAPFLLDSLPDVAPVGGVDFGAVTTTSAGLRLMLLLSLMAALGWTLGAAVDASPRLGSGAVRPAVLVIALVWAFATVQFSQWLFPPERSALSAVGFCASTALGAVASLWVARLKFRRPSAAFHQRIQAFVLAPAFVLGFFFLAVIDLTA